MKRVKIVALVTGSLLVAGVAWAAWTANGTGNGYGESTTAQLVGTNDTTGLASAVAIATETDQLYPGSSGDVKISITNPNPYTVTIDTITLADDPATTTTNDIVTSTPDATCNASTGLTFGTAGVVTGTWVVPADSTGTSFTLDEALHMSNSSVDACQNETFKVPVTLAGTSTPATNDPD